MSFEKQICVFIIQICVYKNRFALINAVYYRAFVFSNTNLSICHRNASDTNTSDTEDDRRCGGLGKFEYSRKGLPHALVHMPELVMRGGHHGAFCTFLAEVAHKHNIKLPAKLARTYGSENLSQAQMLQLMLDHEIYGAAIKRSAFFASSIMSDSHSGGVSDEAVAPPTTSIDRSPKNYLPYMEQWSGRTLPPGRAWESVFLSAKARITRGEVLNVVCRKLEISRDEAGRARLLKHLHWECFGTLLEEAQDLSLTRKFVGICPAVPKRRDFVRIKDPGGDDIQTCLSCELILFIKLSGFTTEGVELPRRYRSPLTNTESVVFALIRWLSPHPDAILRDSKHRPMCPSPLDINHALWRYSTENRPLLTQTIINRHLADYPGLNVQDKLNNSILEREAMFDLVVPESFETFMNCSITDNNTLLETITLPFT